MKSYVIRYKKLIDKTPNNYRKMHGEPMKRWVQLRKVCERRSHNPFKRLEDGLRSISRATEKAAVTIREWTNEVQKLSKLVAGKSEENNEEARL